MNTTNELYIPPDYTNFESAFPLLEKDPLVREGDLRPIYSNKTGHLPECLEPSSFWVTEETPARIEWSDLELMEGLDKILETGPVMWRTLRGNNERYYRQFTEFIIGNREKSEFDGTYFIVDIGHAHLPGVAYKLLQQRIDCSFAIHEKINSRFHQAIKYWARRYQEEKDHQQQFVGYATFVDIHRTNSIPVDVLPDAKRLRELGIGRVTYLNESAAYRTRTNPIDGVDFRHPDALKPRLGINNVAQDIRPIIEGYVQWLPVSMFGIDNRQNRFHEKHSY